MKSRLLMPAPRLRSGHRIGSNEYFDRGSAIATDVGRCPLWVIGGLLTKSGHVRFSNRPVGVKRFQATHRCSVDVAHGLALLSGIGTEAVPSWDPRARRNNLYRGLTVRRTAGPSGHANSPHPSSREGHHSTTRWSSSFLLLPLILFGSHAAAVSLVHRNSVPSIHMRCRITANRRASATIAFFIPRRLAICIAQALSHDHFFERIML
jgi:hypothetical protein